MRVNIKRKFMFFAVVSALVVSFVAQAGPPAHTKRPVPPRMSHTQPLIQVAILLDTSGSMEGLIGQAKNQLWRIVNQLGTLRKRGQSPRLQVALYEYGNSGVSQWTGYVRQISPFTTDLDRVSEELFSLRTNGGDEYCGQVIQTAARDLNWSTSRDALKLMYIAGNEPFSQGTIPYSVGIAQAQERGVVVNTIYCGTPSAPEASGWRHGADLAMGAFASIDHNHQVVDAPAPQDAALLRLGKELNQTYMGYGVKGKAKKARQNAVDRSARSAGMGVAASRVRAKAGELYTASDWDLVDAVEEGEVVLGELAAPALPPALAAMSVQERTQEVKKAAKNRKEIQKKIQKLSQEREAFLAKQAKKESGAPSTLDSAVIDSIMGAATGAGFESTK